MAQSESNKIKLNLGCGHNLLSGYVNVDKFGSPDVMWDLEAAPWPWEDNSVDEVLMHHVLEHLGRDTVIYYQIVKELYRVCARGAMIHVAVPHPRHDDFLGDPSHVRVVVPEGWLLFSKAKNRYWKENNFSNSPLAMYLDVDFEVADTKYVLDPVWSEKLKSGAVTGQQITEYARQFNNVVKEIKMDIRVVK